MTSQISRRRDIALVLDAVRVLLAGDQLPEGIIDRLEAVLVDVDLGGTVTRTRPVRGVAPAPGRSNQSRDAGLVHPGARRRPLTNLARTVER